MSSKDNLFPFPSTVSKVQWAYYCESPGRSLHAMPCVDMCGHVRRLPCSNACAVHGNAINQWLAFYI